MNLEFDKVEVPECDPAGPIGNPVDPTTCRTEPPGDEPPVEDERCLDPAFAEANPDICKEFPKLVLKPSFALVASGGTVQYRTFLRTDGDEQELLLGLDYVVANSNVAVIHRTSGLATGVATGASTVSVQWQNLHAFAEIEVVNSCADIETQFLLLFDNSKSSKAAFSSNYATRLSFAKEAGRLFAETVNYSKDKVGVAKFSTGGEIVLELSQVKATIQSAIAGIGATDSDTDIAAGLQTAIDYLATTGEGVKVIVLFSDGENNDGVDPAVVASAWRGEGNIIMVVALRAWGEWFDLLHRISSDGFFLSAYDNDTGSEAIEALQGLKTYLCSADCYPEAGTYPMAKLNYREFINWDVFQGNVDLVGLGLFDVQPGHGLYVDLAGTKNAIYPSPEMISPGGIITKESFDFTGGQEYQFSIKVAGNNVGGGGADADEPVRVRIIKDDDTTLLDEEITPTSFDMPFTLYEFSFTPGADATAKIKIELVQHTANNVGPLIDDVVLENITTSTVIFSDDFNNENEVTIPFYYQYYQCTDAPPGAQSADPTPPEVIEG